MKIKMSDDTKSKMVSTAKSGAKSIGGKIATEVGIALLETAIDALTNKKNSKK